jgi:hypothetical protein
MVYRSGNEDWQAMPFSHGYSTNSRGMGVADMAHAIRANRPHRCSGDLAHHVLEIMRAFEKASQSGARVDLESTCERLASLPLGLPPGLLDEG